MLLDGRHNSRWVRSAFEHFDYVDDFDTSGSVKNKTHSYHSATINTDNIDLQFVLVETEKETKQNKKKGNTI